MATLYPRQSYDKMVFNHSLPDWLYDPSSGSNQYRTIYPSADGFTTSMFINPQELMVASPLSPSSFEEQAYTAPTPYQQQPREHSIEERSRDDYISGTPRKRPTQAAWYPDQPQKSYVLERGSGNRSSHHSTIYHTSLPTPPLSPTDIIPIQTQPQAQPQTRIATTSLTMLTPTAPSQRHYCLQPSCLDPHTSKPTKSFSRRADLQRHNTCQHDPTRLFSCPRPNCDRKGENGFTRQDHLVEHRRGYHGEPIPKRGSRSRTTGKQGSGERRR